MRPPSVRRVREDAIFNRQDTFPIHPLDAELWGSPCGIWATPRDPGRPRSVAPRAIAFTPWDRAARRGTKTMVLVQAKYFHFVERIRLGAGYPSVT